MKPSQTRTRMSARSAEPSISMPIRDTKTAILAAAKHLFAEEGFKKVSTREIAKVVGIASPSIYKHFRSINDIVAEVLKAASECRSNAYRRILAEGTGTSTRETLKRIAIEMIAGFQRDPTLLHLYQQVFDPHSFKAMELSAALWDKGLQPELIRLVSKVDAEADPSFSYYTLFAFALGAELFRPTHEMRRPLKRWQKNPIYLAERGLAAALPRIDWTKVEPCNRMAK